MYSYDNDSFLGPNNFSSYSSTTTRVSPFRSGFNTNFSQLPAIKEEDGSGSEEESEINTKSLCDVQSFATFPSVNINCLMNIDVKQSHSIWNTNFGKRLINQNSFCEILSEPYVTDISFVKKTNKKSKPKTLIKKKIARNRKHGKEDKKEFSQTRSSRKKSEKLSNENLMINESIIRNEPLLTISKTSSTEKSPENSETVLSQETLTVSLNSRPIFLADYIKSIFENYSDQFNCDHCNEIFSDIEEFHNHEKQHEMEKENCLLCERVFYDSSKFAQHLLTHEGVDRFSCKKCKKYFPSAKKHNEHHQEVHCKPPPIITYFSRSELEYVKKWLPKFECKRCKLELDSEKSYKKHKRAHLRRDLARAYPLSQEYVKTSINKVKNV